MNDIINQRINDIAEEHRQVRKFLTEYISQEDRELSAKRLTELETEYNELIKQKKEL